MNTNKYDLWKKNESAQKQKRFMSWWTLFLKKKKKKVWKVDFSRSFKNSVASSKSIFSPFSLDEKTSFEMGEVFLRFVIVNCEVKQRRVFDIWMGE